MKILPLICLLIVFILPLSGNANVQVIQQIKKNLQDDLTNLVKKADPEAVVIVRLNPSIKTKKLPGTVFSLSSLELDEEQLRLVFLESQIKVLTKNEELVKTIEPFMKEIASSYNIPVVITYNSGEYSNIGVFAQTEELSKKGYWASYLEGMKKLIKGDASAFLIFFLSIIFFASLMIAHAYSGARAASKISVSLQEGLSSLSQSMAGDQKSFDEANSNESTVSGVERDPILENLSTESLSALLYDCYWSKLDSYARYIWNRVPISKKEQIISESKILNAYVSFLSSESKEQYFNYHMSSYYLKPRNWSHISNEDVSSLVKKNHAVFFHLSPVRQKNLQLSVEEQALIIKDLSLADKKFVEVPKKASPERELISYTGIEFRNFEEEWQLSQLGNLPLEVLEKTPTLVWSNELNDDIINNILKNYSAKELAQSWVGPSQLFDRWTNLINEKKLNLILSYVESQTANRSNKNYIKLHKEIVAEVKSQRREQQGENNEVPVSKAA